MRITKSYKGKMGLSIILVSFVALFSVLFFNLQVSSQKEKNIQNENMANTPQEKDDDKNDGIQEYINVLTEDKTEIPSTKKIEAIQQLGNANQKRAIPILIKYLDYEDKSGPDKNVDSVDKVNLTERDDKSPTKQYPAIGALMQLGKPALPSLVEIVERESPDSTRSRNARITIQYIFLRDNPLDGVLYLEKAASESKIPSGSKRLLLAAEEMKKIVNKLQK